MPQYRTNREPAPLPFTIHLEIRFSRDEHAALLETARQLHAEPIQLLCEIFSAAQAVMSKVYNPPKEHPLCPPK